MSMGLLVSFKLYGLFQVAQEHTGYFICDNKFSKLWLFKAKDAIMSIDQNVLSSPFCIEHWACHGQQYVKQLMLLSSAIVYSDPDFLAGSCKHTRGTGNNYFKEQDKIKIYLAQVNGHVLVS